MKLLDAFLPNKNECNVGRQFEFDFAKFICILGMIFVHLFETFPISENVASGKAYYIMVIVLDAVFGAGTFMGCMGFGIAYSKNNDYAKLMKRGIWIFILGYILNALRDGLPTAILSIFGFISYKYAIYYTLCGDILAFAGLALFLFGLLKKIQLSDLGLCIVSVLMSVIGSIFRFVEIPGIATAEIVGLFISDYCPTVDEYLSCFPILNWFIVVVLGYLYGKYLRRIKDVEKFYTFALPISAVLLGAYMAVAIPLRLGMMNEGIQFYYAFITPEALVLFVGMIFATSAYHFIGKLFGQKIKNVITRVSANINSIYCIHWVILSWVSYVLYILEVEISSPLVIFLTGIALFVTSALLADLYKKSKQKKKVNNA